jgi:subtilisin family serine protease
MVSNSARLLRPHNVVVLALAVLATMFMPRFTSAERSVASDRGSGSATGAFLVTVRPGVSNAEAKALLGRAGATEIGSVSSLGVRVVHVPLLRSWSAVRKLSADPRVASVEADGTATATAEPRDPQWGRQWGPRAVRAPGAWGVTTGSRETVIAIVDTGVDADHPDLRGRVLRGWDFHGNDANPRDENGHGTAVAGVAAAAGNNGVGIAGMCWKCRILPVRVLNANGSGSHSNIAAGIVWAANHGADVINLSLATPTRTNIMSDAVAYARRRGAVVVAAAGNEGSRRRYFPAALPGVISVAASQSSGRLYNWSNRGTWIKLAAPGCAYTTRRGGSWSWWCGTSFAAPAVAGTIALVDSLNPGLSRSRLESSVLSTASAALRASRARLDAARAVHSAN